jgi:DNA-directed RNA polymerase specialized sigma24 family protein
MSSTAERYLKRLEADPQARLALLACSAALQIDDNTACEAVELVASRNGATRALVTRVKRLGCVWKEWNGFWHVSEDVRRDLVAQLHRELPETTIIKLRELLARSADSRAAQLEQQTDQVSYHEKLFASLEASYHRLLVPKTAEEGANVLVDLWRRLPPESGEALARSADYLADEIKELSGMSALPDALVFLRGVAAQVRGDKHAQEKYFVTIWRDGRDRSEPGFVHAKAGHFLGQIIQDRNPKGAERALRTSFKWMDAERERGLILSDLGELIGKDDSRRDEALRVYRESLDLLPAKDQVRVHLAIAALLEKSAADRSYSQLIKREDPRQEVPLPEPLFDEVDVSPEKLRQQVESDMHDFCLNYVRIRGNTIKTVALVGELYARFFDAGDIWKDELEFFTYVARLSRRTLMDHAQNYPTLNIDISLGAKQANASSIRPKHYVLDLDEAFTRLESIDPEQAPMIELLFYAGLSPARVAALLNVSEDTVSGEWKFAKAFLFREVGRESAVRNGINLPTGQISRKTLSMQLR